MTPTKRDTIVASVIVLIVFFLVVAFILYNTFISNSSMIKNSSSLNQITGNYVYENTKSKVQVNKTQYLNSKFNKTGNDG